MRVARQMTVLAAVAGLAALPAGGLAQSAGSIPNQPWYPAGYLDMREAAASQVEDFPRNPRVVLMEDWDDPNLKTYDVIDCMLGWTANARPTGQPASSRADASRMIGS